MSNINDMISQLAAAKEAMDRLPVLETEIRDLHQILDQYNGDLIKAREDLALLRDQLNQANAKLREVEAERDDYFLRAEDAEERMAKVGSLLGLVPATAQPSAPAVIQPEPQAQSAASVGTMDLSMPAGPNGNSVSDPITEAALADGWMPEPEAELNASGIVHDFGSPKPSTDLQSTTAIETHPEWLRRQEESYVANRYGWNG